MTEDGIGVPLCRREVRRFLTGHGRYVHDIVRPQQLHAVLLRSPQAHAEIVAIEKAEALASLGVAAIFTAEDITADKLNGVPCVSDPLSGQLLTGSFMDYRMPRADDLPQIAVSTRSTRCRHNPLGVKGGGEVGTIASPATVMSAVADALSPYGITHLDMPATPQRIWHAIQAARQPASA